MSADIINLRQARKRKSRVEKEAEAAENRKVFGRTRAERRHAEAAKALDEKALSGKKRSLPAADNTEK
ncbi:MAG: DUF4169 family protein [Hyphomicrobiaceae bacterium]